MVLLSHNNNNKKIMIIIRGDFCELIILISIIIINFVYIKKDSGRTQQSPCFICQSAPVFALRLGRTRWLQLLNYESVKCRMLWAGAKTNWPEAAIRGSFPLWKGIRMDCHSAGSCRAEALLKKSFRELRCPRLGQQSSWKKKHLLNKNTK